MKRSSDKKQKKNPSLSTTRRKHSRRFSGYPQQELAISAQQQGRRRLYFWWKITIDEVIFRSLEDALVIREGRKHFSPEIGARFNAYLRTIFIHDFIDEFHRVNKREAYKRRIVFLDEEGQDIILRNYANSWSGA